VTAQAASAQHGELASLINQRLSYMKDVAGYKVNHHLAIEDLPQEARVLSGSLSEAEKLGIDGRSVTPFIQAQMDAAKAIQYRYCADWLSVPEKGWQPDSLERVRSEISALNISILTRISQQLTKGERLTDKSAFMTKIDLTHLKNGDKERLWDSRKLITLKNSQHKKRGLCKTH